MDLAEALTRLSNANLCASIAGALLLLYLLSLAWDKTNESPASGQWCRQHNQPRFECRDQHRD